MQRRVKKSHSKKTISPLLPLLPIILVISVLQGIIAIFSRIHFPILLIDLFFVLFYFCIMLLELWNVYKYHPFKNKSDLFKLIGWIITSRSFASIQIENGVPELDRPLGRQRKLISIDPTSAAAFLQKSDQQIQILPPGVYCIDKNTTLLSAFDLRTQTTLFPFRGKTDQVMTIDENAVSGSKSDFRSSFLTASTNDSYQVGAKFLVQYKYDIEFGQGENPYGFDPAILRNVHAGDTFRAGTILDPQLISKRRIQQILLSTWQTAISQFSLLELISQENVQNSALESIEAEIQRQIIKGKNGESSLPVKQLQGYGLKILSIAFHSLWLPEETEIAIQHHWQPQARQLVDTYQSYQQQKRKLHQEIGEIQALYTFLDEQKRAG